MSKQSLKQIMSINQKDNRMELEKYSTTYNKVSNVSSNNHQQQEVADFAQNTLRDKVDISVFTKTKEDINFLKNMKASTKHIKL